MKNYVQLNESGKKTKRVIIKNDIIVVRFRV